MIFSIVLFFKILCVIIGGGGTFKTIIFIVNYLN
jgi:hypothetical protein